MRNINISIYSNQNMQQTLITIMTMPAFYFHIQLPHIISSFTSEVCKPFVKKNEKNKKIKKKTRTQAYFFFFLH